MDPRLTVVVAEDEALIRMDLLETLDELGFDVVAATGDGRSAVELVAQHAPDLALLDIKMPRMDGLTATSRITESGSTAVVLLTAFSQPELISRAVTAGAMGYLVKPYKPDDVRAALVLAHARSLELRNARATSQAAETRLAERKLIERAKGVIQQRLGCSEDDAYAWLRSAAMSGRTTLAEIAGQVLSTPE